MLTAIVLTLSPTATITLPGYLGRANYAMTLSRLSLVDAELSERLHASDGPKPLTCSGLLNTRQDSPNVTLQAGSRYHVRVTGLTADVSQALEAALLRDRPQAWELHGHRFTVVDASCDAAANPWSGRTSCEELAAASLRAGQVAPAVRLHFASPTAFRSKEVTVPIPLPGLVFGSLVERWNAFSPVTLSPEMRQFAEERIVISRYRLESQAVGQKNAALRIGGVGDVTYRALAQDRYWLSAMQILADYARYSGVGVQTTTGMGQCWRLCRGA